MPLNVAAVAQPGSVATRGYVDAKLTGALTPTAKTAAYTANPGELVLVDATSGAVTITPPTSPAPGSTVGLVKTDTSSNAVTWSGPVNSDAAGAQLVSQWASVTFCWTGSVWTVLSAPVVGGAAPSWASITGKPSFATVATSGAYGDLSGAPTLASVATSGLYADLSGRPSLATVATSGSYADLTGKPATGVSSVNTRSGDVTGLAEQTAVDTLAARVSAPPWAASTTYRVGDLAWQAAVLYRRNTAGTSGASFDASQWDAIGPSADGGGGSDTAGRNVRTAFPNPQVGDWVIQPASSTSSGSLGNGTALLAPLFLPAGTYTAVGIHLNNAGSAGAVIRIVAYADSSGRPGNLAVDCGTFDASTSNGFRQITSGFSLVVPDGGQMVWTGATTQGNPSTVPVAFFVNSTATQTVNPSTPNLALLSQPSFNLTFTGAAPSTATGASVTAGAVRVAFRRTA